MEKEEKTENPDGNESKSQEQIHDLLFSREIGWQEIIYDLINTEQLDPWDINIIFLTDKYLERIKEYEEESYFISSKVLLAAALLLRLKSEMLLNKYIKSIDDILFGKKEEKEEKPQERIELEDEIPELVPKSPIPRERKVTLNELVESLNKAITTENRRIKKEIIGTNAVRESEISMPKKKYIAKNKIKEIYEKLFGHFDSNDEKRIAFSLLIGDAGKEEKIASFSSILHLENQKKIWLHQENHFDEIHIWHGEHYLKNNDPFADLREENPEEISQQDS